MKIDNSLRNYTIIFLIGFALIFFHKNIISTISDYFDSDNSSVIAKIEDSSGVVKVKNQASLWFKEVSTGKKLKDEDTLITNNNSTAQVKFITDDEILIDPNSLVIITLPKESSTNKNIRITFLRGGFKYLKRGNKVGPQIIVEKNDVARMLSGISVEGERVSENFSEPAPSETIVEDILELEREVAAKETPVVEFERPSAPAFTKVKYNYELWNNPPVDPSVGFASVKMAQVSWKNPNVEKIYFQIQLSKFEDFRQIEIEKTTSNEFAEFKAESGLYYARVRAYDKLQNSSIWSPISEIHITTAQPVSLSHQINRSNLARLFWTGDKPNEIYEIEVQNPDSGKKTYFSKHEDFLITLDKSGSYNAKVRVVNESNWPISKWSRPYSFDYQLEHPLASVDENINVEKIGEEPAVEKTVIKMEEEKEHRLKKSKSYVKAGVGTKYYDFMQSNTALLANGQFKSLSPSYNAALVYYLNNNNYLDFNFSFTSIKIKPTEGVTIDKDNFGMMSYGLTGAHLFGRKKESYYTFSGGIYEETAPFISLSAVSDITALESKVLYGMLGLKRTLRYNEKLIYSLAASYHHPISEKLSTATEFDIKPAYSLLGALEIEYILSKNYSLGLAYSLQSTKYDFNFSTPIAGASPGAMETMSNQIYVNLKYIPFINVIYFIRRRKRKES